MLSFAENGGAGRDTLAWLVMDVRIPPKVTQLRLIHSQLVSVCAWSLIQLIGRQVSKSAPSMQKLRSSWNLSYFEIAKRLN